MTETLNGPDFKRFLFDLSNRVQQSKGEFDAMDAACGDGDFGSTMAAAFGLAAKALEGARDDDVGAILTAAGNSILSSAGGTSGPIFGAFFIEAGKAVKGRAEVGLQDLTLMLDESTKRIQLLGGADVGDKTLIDALVPALNALKEAANTATKLRTALDQTAEAASSGCESTKQMIAKKGRARYLGEQTRGFVDPGAYLVSLTFATLAMTKKR